MAKADGTPYDGPVALKVAFFHGATDTAPVIEVTAGLEQVPLLEGIFQVQIQLSAADYGKVFSAVSQAVYVQVTDLTHLPTAPFPRQQVAMIPYAGRIPVDGSSLAFDSSGNLTVSSVSSSIVSGLSGALALKADATDVNAALATKASATHSHTISDVTGLQTSLSSLWSTAAAIGGDVAGTLAATTVSKIQGVSVTAPSAPADNGKYLQFNGTNFVLSPVGAGIGTVTNVTASAPLSVSNGSTTPALSIAKATSAADGYLAQSDWSTFNNKQAAITAASTVNAGTVTSALQNGAELKPFGVVAGNTGELRFDELAANGSNYVGLKAPDSITGNVIWTLPAADGSNGYVLTTNGTGTLSWSAPGTVTSITTGTGLTGGPITGSGTISLANVGIAGSYAKVTTNAQGQVTSGGVLSTGDIPALDVAQITTGTFSVSRGGTGAATLTSNGVLLGNGTSAVSATSAGSADQVLRIPGAGGAPAFGAIDLTKSAAVTGALPVANGGTGASSASANLVFAAPNGSAGAPTFRSLVAADVPSLPASQITSGQLALAQGGTGANLSATGGAGQYLKQASSGGAVSVGAIAAADVPSLDAAKITTGSIGVARGGTGLGSTPTNGQLLIGNGSGFALAAIATGSNGGVTVTNGSGTITLDTPQDLRTTASPTFASINVASIAQSSVIAGSGDATATPAGGMVRGTSGSGSNIAGTNLTVQAGNGTGTGGSGSILFQTAPAGLSSSTADTMATRMTIDGNGNVGIGTATPGAKLHVGGAAGTDGIKFPDGSLMTSAATAAGSYNAGSSSSINWLQGTTQITSTSTSALTFTNMADGGTYRLIATTGSSVRFSFTHAGLTFTFVSPNAATGGQTTLFTFTRAGTKVYVQVSTGRTSYYNLIVADAPAIGYWRLGESSGSSATDSSGSGHTGTFMGGVTLGSTGALDNDSDTSAYFDGTTAGFMYTSASYTNPNPISIEAWFKSVPTTTASLGSVVCFGSSTTGSSGSHDRELVINTTGLPTYYVAGAGVPINGPNPVTDGAWHHLVATTDTTGTLLYVDGQVVAYNSATGAWTGTGYWHIGGCGTNRTIAGYIDEVAIYNYGLSPTQVYSHFVARGY